MISESHWPLTSIAIDQGTDNNNIHNLFDSNIRGGLTANHWRPYWFNFYIIIQRRFQYSGIESQLYHRSVHLTII